MISGKLFEVFNAADKDLLILFAVDILRNIVAYNTFAVTHLTEYAAVGRGNALDRHDRCVGVIVDVIGGFAGEIDILGRDLSVFRQLTNQLGRCDKSSFSVRDRDGMIIADSTRYGS